MVPMIIALQRGFEDDTVVILLDQNEVARKQHVTTDLMKGYAGSFEILLPKGISKIEIIVESRNVSKTVSLNIQDKFYLGLSTSGSTIQEESSSKPLGICSHVLCPDFPFEFS